jgi:hypothetical protein
MEMTDWCCFIYARLYDITFIVVVFAKLKRTNVWGKTAQEDILNYDE